MSRGDELILFLHNMGRDDRVAVRMDRYSDIINFTIPILSLLIDIARHIRYPVFTVPDYIIIL